MRDAMNKIENEEVPMRTMLDAVLDMGEERGRKKSEARGAQELLRGQLQARFGPLSPEADARLAAADAAKLQRWGIRILTAASVAEVFAD